LPCLGVYIKCKCVRLLLLPLSTAAWFILHACFHVKHFITSTEIKSLLYGHVKDIGLAVNKGSLRLACVVGLPI
jgi:hypothetical protein